MPQHRYWGSGYDRRLGGNGNNKLFAFSIAGKRHDDDEHDGDDDGEQVVLRWEGLESPSQRCDAISQSSS